MKKIKNPRRISDLAKAKKAVFHKQLGKHLPAAFVVNYPLAMVLRLIDAGQLFEYTPKK